jgi:DNA-binding NarL/FixJ family response regulator
MSTRSGPRLRLLLADDHLVVREGLKTFLQRVGFDVVAEASDGRTAVQMCHTLNPEVAVLDVGMPLLNGVDAAREILRSQPDLKIVLLTMYTEESFVLAGLRAGVQGYVLKSNAPLSLVQAIRAVARGDMYLGLGVAGTVVDACLSKPQPTGDPLSCRERQVLQLIAEGKTMKEIGGLLGISPRTAETHRGRIMNRLKVHDVAGLVRYAMDRGMVQSTRRADGETSVSTTLKKA